MSYDTDATPDMFVEEMSLNDKSDDHSRIDEDADDDGFIMMELGESEAEKSYINSVARNIPDTEVSTQNQDGDLVIQKLIDSDVRRAVGKIMDHASLSWSVRTWREKVMKLINLRVVDSHAKATIARIVIEELQVFVAMSQDSDNENEEDEEETERQEDTTQGQNDSASNRDPEIDRYRTDGDDEDDAEQTQQQVQTFFRSIKLFPSLCELCFDVQPCGSDDLSCSSKFRLARW